MQSSVYGGIEAGPLPGSDGWGFLYHAFERFAPTGSHRRRVVCRYFYPSGLERWRNGLVFRLLGVQLFGAIIPTGGIVVRRITGARMAAYTLAGYSLGAARAFYYRACVFETLHMPFFVTLAALALYRAVNGRLDLALEDTAVNLVANVYPVMHHRQTRTRIIRLIDRRVGRERHVEARPSD